MFALKAQPIRVCPTYKRRKVSKVCKSKYTIDQTNSKALERVRHDDLFHVLTFYRPDAEQGIYSVRQMDDEDLPTDYIVAFTTFEDAFRFKTLLDAEMHLHAYVQFASRYELEHACQVCGVKCRVVDEGVLVTPPTRTLSITDWERRTKLLNGRWTVREKEEGV